MGLVKWVEILLFTLLSSICPAQNVSEERHFNHFSAEYKTSPTAGLSILQDRKGYMWFGSFTGLVKFDGYNITNFNFDPNNKNSIPNNSSNHLCEDGEGNLWISHDAYPSLTKRNPHTGEFTIFRRDDNNKFAGPPGSVSCLTTDKTGTLWIGTDRGLCFYESRTNKFINVSDIILPDTLCSGEIRCLMMDHKGLLWIGTANGINIYDPTQKKLILFNPPDKNYSTVGKQVLSILEDHSGDIWVSLWWAKSENSGIYRFSPSTNTSKIYSPSFTDPNSLSSGYINTLLEDSHHTIWAGMYEGGLCEYQPASDNFRTYRTDGTNPNKLNSNQVVSLFQDRSGVFWIGTNGGGLNNFYPINTNFKVYQSYDKEFISHYPLSLYKDHSGKIYLSTLGAGVNEFDPVSGKFKSYKIVLPNDKLNAFNFSYGMVDASDGNLWIVGYDEGLYTLDRKSGKITTMHSTSDNRDTTSHNIFNCIVEDGNKRLWIGTNNGLKCYDLKTKVLSGVETLYRDPNNLSKDRIVSLNYDKEEILWIAGSNGLTLLNTKTGETNIFKHDNNNPHSISFNIISCFYDDGKGTVWLGTEGGGLNKFEKIKQQFTSYTTKDGLPDNTIYGILNDDHGNLWLSTNKGICKFTQPSSQNDKVVCRNYNMSDGLPADEFFFNASIKADDGTLYFASNAGLVAFRPEELRDNPYIPPVVVTDFSVFHKSVRPGDSTGLLKFEIDETKEIKLSYRQNVFSFAFSALSYVHPEKNQYAYMLEGFDKEWIYTDATRRFANYTNLGAGTYTFKVRASNNDGVWNEEGTSIKVIVLPPYWQTLWFSLLCGLAGGMILYAIYMNRMQKVREIRRIRNKIASDLHDDLGATLSSISIMSELVNQQVKAQSPQVSSLLEKIGSSSRNMIESVNDMVWAINPQNDSFENIIKRMRTFASEILAAKDIAFHFDFDKNLLQSKLKMEMRRNFYLIFKEAVNNLAKYSNATNAFVMIWNRENNLVMTVRDDGSGFEMNSVEVGNGLINMQQRANFMKARFKLESIPSKGTTIELEFKND